jgi:transcriptional regulator with XRE-family HTH domain
MILTEQDIIDKLKRRGLSVRVLAKDVGVSHGYVYDVLRGKRAPGKKILDYLGVTKVFTVTYETTRKGRTR